MILTKLENSSGIFGELLEIQIISTYDFKSTEQTIVMQTKQTIIEKFKTHTTDTGSCEVQVALLTERISSLTQHLAQHKKDFHSRRGLIAMANKRRKLLNYLKTHNFQRYTQLITSLGIRK